MRLKKRIDIYMKHIDIQDYVRFLIETTDLSVYPDSIYIPKKPKKDIIKFWKDNPDLRLTQVLVAMGILHNYPGSWYYTEETKYLLEYKKLKPSEVLFWGVNYDKDMNKYRTTKWKLIKDLNTDHIRSIIDGGYSDKIPSYLEVFKQELNERND